MLAVAPGTLARKRRLPRPSPRSTRRQATSRDASASSRCGVRGLSPEVFRVVSRLETELVVCSRDVPKTPRVVGNSVVDAEAKHGGRFQCARDEACKVAVAEPGHVMPWHQRAVLGIDGS